MKYRLIKVSETDWKEAAMLSGLESLGRILSEEETLNIFRQTWSEGFADAKHDERGLVSKYKGGFNEYAKENL